MNVEIIKGAAVGFDQMTTTEKLNRIADKCRELLDMQATKTHTSDWKVRYLKGDSAYIQECREQAVAGWKATIAAIEGLIEIANHGQEPERGAARYDLNKIIAAWPEELL